MKKLLILTFALSLSAGIFAQGPFTGFLKPSSTLAVDDYSLYKVRGDDYHEWYFRPVAQMTAIQFNYNKESKQFESSTFNSTGIGVGYQHYIVDNENNNVNNYGINALLMIDGSQSSAGIGGAITINALQFVNLGGGYSFTNKAFFLLTGAVWAF